ncbi:MAG: DNA damage-inducible protein D [Tannerellaceae bacterium]|nr:DNA damage-inducible protein D [Tannerellaceae bacterium]
MRSEEVKALFEQFEAVAMNLDGVECWSARDLQKLLGYSQWRNFLKIIEKAKSSCGNTGETIGYHFADISKLIRIGKNTEKEISDMLLTRYACYLIAQNGESYKPEISFAQTYFAVQTRRAELIEKGLAQGGTCSDNTEEGLRLEARERLMRKEKTLSGILYKRGIDNKGFAVIRSKGDEALFKLNTAELKRKMNIPDNRPLADFLPTIGIEAKGLAAEMTSINVQDKDLHGQTPIEQEHIDNNEAVRNMLVSRGIHPERLQPAEDIKKVERRIERGRKKALMENH